MPLYRGSKGKEIGGNMACGNGSGFLASERAEEPQQRI